VQEVYDRGQVLEAFHLAEALALQVKWMAFTNDLLPPWQ